MVGGVSLAVYNETHVSCWAAILDISIRSLPTPHSKEGIG